MLHLDILCQWQSVVLRHLGANAITGNETNDAGGNGYGGNYTTISSMARLPWFYVYLTINNLALTTGRLDDLFVSDVHISLVFYG